MILLIFTSVFFFGSMICEASQIPKAIVETINVPQSKFVFDSGLDFQAILPPNYDAKKAYPVLYFLGGQGDNADDLLYGDAKMVGIYEELLYKEKIGEFIIVCPAPGANGGSFFVNWKNEEGRNYEDYFVKELFPFVEKTYHIIDSPKAKGISGFSMGGYGAFMLSVRHPKMFDSISSMAGMLSVFLFEEQNVWNDFFGYKDIQELHQYSPGSLLRSIVCEDPEFIEKKYFYLTVGGNDERLMLHFNYMVGTLQQLKANYQAKVIDGGYHDYKYLAKALPEALIFHWNHFAETIKKQSK